MQVLFLILDYKIIKREKERESTYKWILNFIILLKILSHTCCGLGTKFCFGTISNFS